MSSAMAWQQPGPSARQIGQSAHGLAAGRTGTCGSWTLARISTQRIHPSGLAELEAQAAVLPPGDGGVGAQVSLAQDG